MTNGIKDDDSRLWFRKFQQLDQGLQSKGAVSSNSGLLISRFLNESRLWILALPIRIWRWIRVKRLLVRILKAKSNDLEAEHFLAQICCDSNGVWLWLRRFSARNWRQSRAGWSQLLMAIPYSTSAHVRLKFEDISEPVVISHYMVI